jgi:hypothetical protein
MNQILGKSGDNFNSNVSLIVVNIYSQSEVLMGGEASACVYTVGLGDGRYYSTYVG